VLSKNVMSRQVMARKVLGFKSVIVTLTFLWLKISKFRVVNP
jgi:hypothetical protein